MRVYGLACLTAGTFFCATPVVAENNGSPSTKETRLVITGVVCHVERDGGYYFIRSDDEKDYDPGASLPEEFRKAPLRVRIEAKMGGDPTKGHGRGELVEILKIEKDNSPPPMPARKETALVTTGTVVHVPLEGGFHGIKSDNGRRYDPGKSLPEKFRKPNLRVRIEGKVLEGVPTFRMWGEVIEIRKIEAVTPSPPDKEAAAEQGVAGKVVKLAGNFMPSPGPEPRRGAKKPLSVPVHIFKGQLKVFEKPNTEHPAFVQKIQADAGGNFRCVLPPGEYTVVAEIDGKLYLNSFTAGDKGSLCWSTVKIEKQKWTTFNIVDSSGAVF
jgi:hypothetical protein